MKDVPVIGVDDQRHATDARRQPTNRTRFGHMCMNNVRTDVAHQLDHARQSDKVVERADLSAERWQDLRLHRVRQGKIQHVALMWSGGACDQGGLEQRAIIESRGEQDGVNSRTADVEARDRAQHLDGRRHASMVTNGFWPQAVS